MLSSRAPEKGGRFSVYPSLRIEEDHISRRTTANDPAIGFLPTRAQSQNGRFAPTSGGATAADNMGCDCSIAIDHSGVLGRNNTRLEK